MTPVSRTLVSQVMRRDCPTVRADATFQELARLMVGEHVHAIPVLDETGRAVGIVSDTDLVRAEARVARRDGHAPPTAGALMSAPAVGIGSSATVREAEVLSASADVRQLVVVDREGRVLGLVSRRDLLADHLRPDAEIRRGIDEDVLGEMFDLERGTVEVEVLDGVVTLRGQLEASVVEGDVLEAVRRRPGVVDVVSLLTRPHGIRP